MAFTPTSGVGGYVGTPKGPKRPYTRSRPPDVADAARRVRTSLPRQTVQPPATPQTATPQAPAQAPGAASGAQAAAQANAAGAAADGLEQYLAGITDPNERAYVAAQIGPKIAMLRAQQQALANQVAAEQAAIQSLNAAAGAAIKGLLGGVGGSYDQVEGVQTGSGKQQAGAMKGVGKGVSAENAAILGAIGAPEAQVGELADANKATFTVGGKVLQGVGGDIPAWATDLTGQGVEQWAAAQPGIASAYADEASRAVQADAARSWAGTNTDLVSIEQQIPGIRQDYADQTEQDWSKRFSQMTQLYNMGMLTQRQFATMVGLPGADSYPDTLKASGSTHMVPFTDPATGRKGLYNPDTGKSIIIPGQGVRPVKETAPKAWQVKKMYGHSVLFNPNDATFHDPVTKAVLTTLPGPDKKPAALPVPNLSNSIAVQQWVDKNMRPIPSLAGTPVPPRWKPDATKPQGGSGTAEKATQAEINAAIKILNDGYLHAPGRHARLSGDKPSLVRIFNLHKTGLVANGIKDWKELRAALPNMTAKDLSDLGIQGMIRNPQDVYMDMVHRGMQPYDAYTRVKKYWPTFDSNNSYFPYGDPAKKASPAAETAGAAPVTKWVGFRPGFDRPGMKTHEPVLQFIAQIAKGRGKKVTVTTGTDHDQLTVDGNVSAHWAGWAVDLALNQNPVGVVTPDVTRLGQDALIAAGMPVAQARKTYKWEGGDYNGYNILFNTSVGGNHYNHVHVGLKPSRQNATGGGAPWYTKRAPATPESTNPASAPYNVDAARTKQGAISATKAIAADSGWTGNEWANLYALWDHESGGTWSAAVKNYEGSGATGIPQRMLSVHPIQPGEDYLTNPISQIKWGIKYIKERYKTPSRAWAFERATIARNASIAPPDLRKAAQDWINHGWQGY